MIQSTGMAFCLALLSALQALCDYALYKFTLHLHIFQSLSYEIMDEIIEIYKRTVNSRFGIKGVGLCLAILSFRKFSF